MRKLLFALCLLPFLFAGCTQNNVAENRQLQVYFDSAKVNGCFGLFNNGEGSFSIYNLSRYRDSAYQPAGTFRILLSLVGLQTGVIKDEKGGVKEAFQAADDTAFGKIALQIGKDTLKRWIDSLGYGNKNLEGTADTFWRNNHLKVKADEELGLVKKLYFNQLPFFQRSQKIVQEMMLVESNANYQLSYVTGDGVREDGRKFVWVLGWIEESKHPYFFVLNLDTTDPGADSRNTGLPLLRKILDHEGFFQGKK